MTSNVYYQPKKSIVFDGSNDYLEISNQGSGVANLNPASTEAFSVSAWCYPVDFASYSIIATNQEASSPYEGWSFGWQSQRLDFVIYNSSATKLNTYSALNTSTDPFFVMNRWTCVVATFDGSNNITGVKLYKDGTQLETTSSGTTIGTVNSAAGIRIGNAPWGASTFDGALHGVAFWNKELSAKEIAEIYRGRGGTPGPGNLNFHSAASNLISWWIADNPSDAYDGTIYDEKGSFNMTANNLASDALIDLAP
tara:strand:+ start:280 stop:1038 length:759 start_codon:yes stop_codon:yes gene_type:complete